MAAYLIVELVELKDANEFSQYRRQAGPVIARYGGEYLAATDRIDVLEGEWHFRRGAIIEFPSMDHIRDLFRSPEFAPLRELRRRAGKFNFIAIEGL